jgi:hypothetical protein
MHPLKIVEFQKVFHNITPDKGQCVHILRGMFRAIQGPLDSLCQESAFERSIEVHRAERPAG